jgi:hypothetical protein
MSSIYPLIDEQCYDNFDFTMLIFVSVNVP